MNLKEWAVTQGVSYSTVLRWHEDGVLPVPTCQVGRLVVIGGGAVSRTSGTIVVYARVSCADQRPDLDRRVCRVTTWATGQRLRVGRVVTEMGSALNGAAAG
jgi:predicted site-specific integrase-resolvase